jgi:hypothetical protein
LSFKKKFNNSLLFKTRHHTTPFWCPFAHIQENILFSSSAVASRTFRTNHRKNCMYFLSILTGYKTFWATFLHFTEKLLSDLTKVAHFLMIYYLTLQDCMTIC